MNDNVEKDTIDNTNIPIQNSETDNLDQYGVWIKSKKDPEEPKDEDRLDNDNTINDEELLQIDDTDDDMFFSNTDSLDSLDENIVDDGEDTTMNDFSDTNLDIDDNFESLDPNSFFEDELLDTTNEESIPTDDTDVPLTAEDLTSIQNEVDTITADTDIEDILSEDFEDVLTDSESPLTESEELEELNEIEEKDLDLSVQFDEESNNTKILEDELSAATDDSSDISLFDDIEDVSEEEAETLQNGHIFFDDVEAVEQDLLAENTVASQETPETPQLKTEETLPVENSNELLMQIVKEIEGIKTELNVLKESLNNQTATQTAPVIEKELLLDQSKTEQSPEGFFADDDSDEAVALTGDELNNILITADFTEEPQSEHEAEADDELHYEIPPVLNEEMISEAAPEAEDESHTDSLLDIKPTHINPLPGEINYLDDETEIENEEFETLADTGFSDEEILLDSEKLENFEEINLEYFDLPDEQEIGVQGFGTADDSDDDFFANVSESESTEVSTDITEQTSALDSHDEEAVDLIPESIESSESKKETLLSSASQVAGDSEAQTVPISLDLRNEIKSVLAYMDQLLDALPEEKIEEFAKSEHFESYKHLFQELGIS